MQHIIHAIGPNYRAYEAQGRAAAAYPVLFDAYANSMKEAANRGIRSDSFPTLSTGIFAFPGEDACKIALSAVKQILDEATVAGYQFERVVFLVWQPTGVPSDLRHYNKHFAGV
jgi:O-acetyl-ADP-ribose deacetylase (regulator of RNase III)